MAIVAPPLSNFTPETGMRHTDSNLVIAIHAIGVSDPGADIRHTGAYDADGNAIMRKSTLTIKPGEFFDMPDAGELMRLLEMGAVRYPTEIEMTIREREAR